MTQTEQRPTRAPELGESVGKLAENFTDLMRAFLRTRQSMLQAAEHNVEWTSHVILRMLAQHGPMRSGAIAECLEADPSTISRQTAAMIKEGLLERQSDPDDGRASILALTDQAQHVLLDQNDVRLRFFAGLVTDWTAAEIETFTSLLERFSDAYLNHNHDWVAEKLGQPHRARSTTR